MIACVLLALAACASPARPAREVSTSVTPEWVSLGTLPIEHPGGRLILQAVTDSRSGDRVELETRARSLAEALVELYAARLSAAAFDAGALGAGPKWERVVETARAVASGLAPKIRAGGYWLDGASGIAYASAELDLAELPGALRDLSPEARSALEQNAARVHGELAADECKCAIQTRSGVLTGFCPVELPEAPPQDPRAGMLGCR